MQKTIDAMNTYWNGKKAAVSRGGDEFLVGIVDHFEWIVDYEYYKQTGLPKIKTIFKSVNEGEFETELITDINTFAIKEIEY